MSRHARAALRLRQAQVELAAAERALIKSAQPWRPRLRRHRGTIALLSGFGSGLALALLPSRWWARAGAAAGAVAAGAARSAITPAIIGAVLSRARRSEDASATPRPVPDESPGGASS